MCSVEGNKGGKWDTFNSIINKIFFLKKEKPVELFLPEQVRLNP